MRRSGQSSHVVLRQFRLRIGQLSIIDSALQCMRGAPWRATLSSVILFSHLCPKISQGVYDEIVIQKHVKLKELLDTIDKDFLRTYRINFKFAIHPFPINTG